MSLMEQKKFEAILRIIIPDIIHLIVTHYNTDEITAASIFYSSKVYSLLEEEETKLWQLSSMAIFNMIDEERKSGVVVFPEGG